MSISTFLKHNSGRHCQTSDIVYRPGLSHIKWAASIWSSYNIIMSILFENCTNEKCSAFEMSKFCKRVTKFVKFDMHFTANFSKKKNMNRDRKSKKHRFSKKFSENDFCIWRKKKNLREINEINFFRSDRKDICALV